MSSANPRSGEEEEKGAPPNNNDLVIRDGFPALTLPSSGGPKIDGPDPLPRHPVWADAHALTFGPAAPSCAGAPLQATTYIPQHWHDDCQTVFTARTRDADASYSAGTTYFWPALMKPRCALEALVQSIFERHTRHLLPNAKEDADEKATVVPEEATFVPELSGAEWWTLVLDDDEEDDDDDGDDHQQQQQQQPTSLTADQKNNSKDDADSSSSDEEQDEVGLHFDADYGLEAQVPNLLLHPRLATVTYLTDTGAPTVVLDQKSPPPSDDTAQTLQGSVRRAWLSHPVTGKHLAFDGRLLHGAPSRFFPGRTRTAASAAATKEEEEEEDAPPRASKRPRVDEHPAAAVAAALPRNENGNGKQQQRSRITLLVNIWLNHCPLDAEPLEEEIVQQLQTPYPNNSKPLFQWNPSLNLQQQQPEPIPKVSLHPASDRDAAGTDEVVLAGRLVTVRYGASLADLHRAAAAASGDDLVELELAPDVVTLEVGDPVPDDSEEEEEEQTKE